MNSNYTTNWAVTVVQLWMCCKYVLVNGKDITLFRILPNATFPEPLELSNALIRLPLEKIPQASADMS